MALSTRNTKLILRIGVMVMAALTLGLAARLILENNELEKLLPVTSTRTLLLIAAPLTSLAVLHFTLAVNSFGDRPLGFEMVAFIAELAPFITIVSPLLIGSWITVAGEECGRWIRSCPDELIWVPFWWAQPAGIAISIALIGGATAYAVRGK